jgi:FkbM family methyltransferase
LADMRTPRLRQVTRRLISGIRNALDIASTIGVADSLRLFVVRGRRPGAHWVTIRGCDRLTVLMRPRESDPLVAAQVFFLRQYSLDPARTRSLRNLAVVWRASGVTPVIVDGGANVGYSSLMLAAAYPEAAVVAIEPSLPSFNLLRRNTASVAAICPCYGALWSDDQGVTLLPGPDGSWSDRVAQADGKVRAPSLRLDQAVDLVPGGRALIVKLDIEGAERAACSAAVRLLRQVPCVMIEPHDWLFPGSGSLVPLLQAMSEREVDVLISGDNIILIDSALATGQDPAGPRVADSE